MSDRAKTPPPASSTSTPRAHTRSWGGCSAGTECLYEVKLRWGGRSFAQSRFGACISESASSSVKKLGDAGGDFVYVTSFQGPSRAAVEPVSKTITGPSEPRPAPSIVSGNDNIVATTAVPLPASSLFTVMENLPLFQAVDPFSNLSRLDRSLLDHFIHGTSHVISCHLIVQEDVCRVIVPAALESPALFYATMALSAIHHKCRAGLDSDALRRDPLISRLMSSSLNQLQRDLFERNAKKVSVLLATIRTLFLCEVHSGADRPGTWRSHFEGAKALMLDIESWQGYSSTERDTTRYFLKRWYNMTEAFVSLTSDSLATGQLARFERRNSSNDDTEIFLDEYTGFTTDLTATFREIGAAAWERRNAQSRYAQPTILYDNDLDEEADYLERSIWTRIDENKITAPRFRPGLEEKLSERQKQDFILCNEAWNHMALIYIHRQISGLPASSPAVQQSVKRILECIDNITATAGLTPLVVLTTPLFTAGCEALDEDRDKVRGLLLRMFELLKIPNMYRSLEVLESFWASPRCGEAQDWDSFMRDQNWDFLPY
ncbi:hypothetical protein MBLNU459_g2169t1 [Dothideomycetes sp. NU459]